MLSVLATAGAAASSVGILHGSLPAVFGRALAAAANTIEHGGQVGIVFELFRNCAGFHRRLEEEIEFNLKEEEKIREHGEILR
ncbi:putative F-box protein [Platanthera zijinensis]|uniref:F-box protein n=1 Tax=Platanthera zijinensis TaxID=2320716 RepID=A0AAP0G168_9ASPA